MARIFSFPLKRRSETVESPFWISYADLMTALVMLFLVVMSISMVAIASKELVAKKKREIALGLFLATGCIIPLTVGDGPGDGDGDSGDDRV